MKLIVGIVFVCFFLLTEAGRVPDDFETINSDAVPDDIRNVYGNPEKSDRRRKPHSRQPRYFSEPEMDRSYYDFYERLRDFEKRLQTQQEQIFELNKQIFNLLSERHESKVIVVPIYLNSSGNDNTSDPLGFKYGEEDEIERERVWGSEDDQNGMRPMSQRPIRPSRPIPKQPPVQHGTIQAETSTEAPTFSLDTCKAAVLICCDSEGDQRRNCFMKFDCLKISYSKNACNKADLKKIKEDIIAAYAPNAD
ncbi:uncharacterized protein LOC111004171 [Pieris rapae]|uniref:uncharacterized protein LOC111004171 n=1 Tax=Pieris rapae TaxID=64459 RepID=UPI001E27F2A7|nr:uncharacterized protein LOC111004171 [Pieris rapae]